MNNHHLTLLITIVLFASCTKSQNGSPDIYDLELSSQSIFSQNVSALQLISNSILNSEPFSFEANEVSSLSDAIDVIIQKSYPLAFSYPSTTVTRTIGTDPVFSLIPNYYMEDLRSTILFDINRFHQVKAGYLQSDVFYALSPTEQADITNYLNTVEFCRNTIIETAFAFPDNAITKVSGAEMRAWSEMAKNMDEESQSMMMDAFFYTVAGVAGGTTGLIIGAIGLIVSWIR
ncbi:MAG: hypothetical protein J5699_08765 [Bacteroidales bacterium]|nr:hypothetical protein [Bacteroidales bacterium]